MERGKVFVDSVVVGDRARTLDGDKVSALAESIKTLGLQQPISVYRDEQDAVRLVAGLHRLEAAKKLGLKEIDACFVSMSPRRREMWELAENLFRVDLSKEQRDAHIRRYAELLAEEERMAEVSRQDVAKPRSGPQGGRPQGIASKIAAETGISTRTVQRVLNPKPAPGPGPKKRTSPTEPSNDPSPVRDEHASNRSDEPDILSGPAYRFTAADDPEDIISGCAEACAALITAALDIIHESKSRALFFAVQEAVERCSVRTGTRRAEEILT